MSKGISFTSCHESKSYFSRNIPTYPPQRKKPALRLSDYRLKRASKLREYCQACNGEKLTRYEIRLGSRVLSSSEGTERLAIINGNGVGMPIWASATPEIEVDRSDRVAE